MYRIFAGRCGLALRKCVAMICLITFVALFSSCEQSSNSGVSGGDVLTQKRTEDGRTQITVLVKYAFSINAFEKIVEEKFPQIDLVQVGNYTHAMGVDEYESRLKHDDLTDIVMTWPLDVGEAYWEDRLLDLSGMEFSSRYNVSMLNSIARDGKLYYVPGPSQVRGLVYNKTLFEEKGWEIPQDFDGFVALCQKIEDSGIRSVQLGFKNSEVLDTAFIGYGYGACFSKPQDNQWRVDYDKGKGSFGDQFAPALDTFQQMIDAGIWKESDLDVDYSQRETMLFTRQCAMVEDSVLLTRMGYGMTGTTDEFALMPFFNPGEESDWSRLYMVCFVGLNQHLAEAQNKEKYDLVLQLMDYISTPEGQDAMMGDTGAMYSSLKGTEPPDIPEIEAMKDSLEHGRYAIFPVLKNAQTALREGLAGMLRGQLTKEDVVELVDRQNLNPPAVDEPEILGTAKESFGLTETGSYIADTMRQRSGCDIALFLDNGKDGRYNGKGVSGRLYEGAVTDDDLKRVLPDLKVGTEGSLWKVTMSGENLRKTLEYAIPTDSESIRGFYYVSGLRVSMDPTAKPGERISRLTTAAGEAIDPQSVYSIAVMDQSVPKDAMNSCEATGILIYDIVKLSIQTDKEISPSKDGRFTLLS